MYNRVCTICGKEFTASFHRERVCSNECREISQKRALKKYYEKKKAERKKEVEKRTCVICGKPIDIDTGRTRYCSQACAKEGWRINNIEANKKKAEEVKSQRVKTTSKPRKSTLDKTLKAMNKYNAKNGTHLDYGQYARMMGL